MAKTDKPDRDRGPERDPSAAPAGPSTPDSAAAEDLTDRFLAVLEGKGFFGQVEQLEASLVKLAEQLQKLGDATVRRLSDVDSLVLHIVALESIVAAMLRAHPVDEDALEAEIRSRAANLGDDGKGEAQVHDIARSLIARHDH